MKRFGYFGLALCTALLLLVLHSLPGSLQNSVGLAQDPSPSPATLPTAPTESPATTPAETPAPSPEASPVPDVTEPPLAPILLLQDEPYVNEAQGYQVGIIENYQSTTLAGVPIIQNDSGEIAYTVAVRPRAADNPLNETALAQVAIDTFAQGEGFQVGPVEAIAGGAKLSWRGTLSQGAASQPMTGVLLSKQVPGKLLILLIAATESQEAEVDAVFETLAESVQPLTLPE